MEVVDIKKILVPNLLIYVYLHCVRSSSWCATMLATLLQTSPISQTSLLVGTFFDVSYSKMALSSTPLYPYRFRIFVFNEKYRENTWMHEKRILHKNWFEPIVLPDKILFSIIYFKPKFILEREQNRSSIALNLLNLALLCICQVYFCEILSFMCVHLTWLPTQ